MASVFTNKGLADLFQYWVSSGYKIMLCDDTLVADVDVNFVAEIVAKEIAVSGYTGGFNGAGRKAIGTLSVTENDTDDRAELVLADLTWSTLGAGTTIGMAVLIKEVTADADSKVIAFIDVSNTPTIAGLNYTLDFAATGLVWGKNL